MKNAKINSFSSPALTSTSAIERNNVFRQRKVRMEIKAKKGVNAFITSNISESEIILGQNQRFKIINFEKISEIASEKEVLFKTGQQFNVTNIIEYDGGLFDIYMEEI